MIVRYKRIHIQGHSDQGKRSSKGVYYRRCTKSIRTGVANIPFTSTIRQIISKMNLKGTKCFWFYIGYGLYLTFVASTIKTEAYEAENRYECKVFVQLTVREKQ